MPSVDVLSTSAIMAGGAFWLGGCFFGSGARRYNSTVDSSPEVDNGRYRCRCRCRCMLLRRPRPAVWCLLLLTLVGSAGAGNMGPGEGVVSYYADSLHGRPTASGAAYDKNAMTAAHKTLAFGTRVRVTNLDNGKTAVVVINDRGPFVKGRILDVSSKAAKQLGMGQAGLAKARIVVLAK
jgi:rare lipoprotein A